MLKNKHVKVITGVWLGISLIGSIQLYRYSVTPGEAATVREFWPQASRIVRVPGQLELLAFAHPQCPCSQAMLGELERLLPRLKAKTDVHVVFVQTESKTETLLKSRLYQMAEKIAGIQIDVDRNYYESDLFGAKTSGQVFLYDNSGRLAFSGGITPTRGHMGESKGRDLLLTWANGQGQRLGRTLVFGCALKNIEDEP